MERRFITNSAEEARRDLAEIAILDESLDEGIRNIILGSSITPEWRLSPAKRLVYWSRQLNQTLRLSGFALVLTVVSVVLVMNDIIPPGRATISAVVATTIMVSLLCGMTATTAYFSQKEVLRAMNELDPKGPNEKGKTGEETSSTKAT